MRHAVLHQLNKGDYYDIITDGASNTVLYAPSLESLHKAMEDLYITTLWVMPNCMFSQQIRSEHFEALDKNVYNWFLPEYPPEIPTSRPYRVYGASVRFNRQNAFKRYFMFPEHREWIVPGKK